MPQSPEYSTAEDGYNPTQAFEHRRQIFHTVQDIQRLEHETMKRIADTTTRHKRELLEILSTWLLTQTGWRAEHRQVEDMTGCPLSEWLSLQSEAASLEREANRCERDAQSAEQAYRDIAPFGIVNEWLANGPDRDRILSRAATAREKADIRNAANARLNGNVEQRRAYAKRFLRSCLANLRQLEESAIFGERARSVVAEMTRTIESEWLGYLRANRESLERIENGVEQLRGIYRMRGA